MFAGSILDLEPDTAYEAQFVLSDPDGVDRRGAEDRDGAHATRAEAGRRRPDVSRLSAGIQGTEARAVVRRADVRVQPDVLRHRLGDRRPSARQAGRHHSRARRPLQVQPARIHERSGRQSHGAARRHVLPDRRRHGGSTDRDQGRGRRRGDLRRRRQLRAVRRQGRRLHLFRRADVPEQRLRDLGGHAVHRRLEGADREALPLRGRRRPASSRTTPAPAISTSPTTTSSAATIRIT